VGASDGWQDFDKHGRMTWTFESADDGNVALMGELPGKSGVLALAFAALQTGAVTLAASSLADGAGDARTRFVDGWKNWGDALRLPAPTPALGAEAQLSACVLKVHEDRTYPGAIVASLSTPWGNSSDSLGGYHLVWTRDCSESALALLAAGQCADAERVLEYLIATQLPDGHWTQNFYPDGRPFWAGVQLDETAFPILLAARLAEDAPPPVQGLERMVVEAAAYVARVGPLSPQDRWEETAGANPFTIAVEVAALCAASQWLEGQDRDYALALADCWNERIEDWCWVKDTPLAQRVGVPGYYVRIQPPGGLGASAPVAIANRSGEMLGAGELVGLEFMYLPRLGLRRPDDPRILATLKVVDEVLLVDTPSGPLYHRYNDDGYGEHEDGSPFDGSGVGRAWPLLSGERGHLALLQGEDPLPYLERMLKCAGPGGLLPEQVWDAAPIPQHELSPGRPSGSAMPLVWAHAEFLKLLIAREIGRPFERLRCVEDRYRGGRLAAAAWHWRTDAPFGRLPAGRALVVESAIPFTLRYAFDGRDDTAERDASALGLGMWGVRIHAEELAGMRSVEFTRRLADEWEGKNWRVDIEGT
jgi:glucoamylase